MKPIIKQIDANTFKVRRIRNTLYRVVSNTPTIYCISKTYGKQIKRALRSAGIIYHQQYENGRRDAEIEIEACVIAYPEDCLEYFYIQKATDWDINLH